MLEHTIFPDKRHVWGVTIRAAPEAALQSTLEGLGLDGDGPTYAGLIRYVINETGLPIEERDVGAEADNAYAYADTQETLEALVMGLQTLLGDLDALTAALEALGEEIG